MKNACCADLHELVGRLDTAVALGDVRSITQQVKEDLQAFTAGGARGLPGACLAAAGDSYARRLVHRAPGDAYTIVAMTWGPRQHTELHDHAGIWCVECIVQGRLEVTQYDLVDERGGQCRFEPRTKVVAGVGDAGCLIPPFEYHVLANPFDDRTAVTLHVYGGEMDHCNAYRPQPGGWWARTPKRLTYTAA
jgi:predicted metal-dependent enzyme (double-stranded beta helix superfamily)